MKKILIIEDEKDISSSIKTALNKQFESIVFEDIISALAYLETNTVDLVLLDLMIAEYSGFSFLRVKGKTLPIIVLSVLPSYDNKKLCMEAGAKMYLNKLNINFTDLPKYINKVLE